MRVHACNRRSLLWSPVASVIDTVVNLAKRRGLVYPSGEIYGGTRSAWDYGPLGVELKENIKRQWWQAVVSGRDDVVGIDSSIILPREVWVASGHVEVFHDPLVECLNCHKRHRQDHMQEAYAAKKGLDDPESVPMTEIVCPDCGTKGQWTEPREFNMMLKTHLGPIETDEGLHYLRPETAQGIFVNFANVVTTSRKKPPFGIGQIGKSFRNEITPGNFIFRTREFEQMEMEFFVEPAAGLTRSFMAFLIDAYTEDEAPNAKGGMDKRTVLRLDPRLAPVKVAVLPLSRHADLSPKARDLAAELRKCWNVEFDDAGAIGRRYRRQDEIGTPYCVTVDFDSLDDHAVTVRERDKMTQDRVSIDGVSDYLASGLRGC